MKGQSFFILICFLFAIGYSHASFFKKANKVPASNAKLKKPRLTTLSMIKSFFYSLTDPLYGMDSSLSRSVASNRMEQVDDSKSLNKNGKKNTKRKPSVGSGRILGTG